MIDSILNAYPIPLVLLADKSAQSGLTLAILDGLQRLHTIVSFIENSFPTEDGRYFNVDEFTRAKEERNQSVTFPINQLQQRLPDPRWREYLTTYFPFPSSATLVTRSLRTSSVDFKPFGHRLSDQERRQAGLVSSFAHFVRDTACEIRGDVSVELLPLYQMPEISVDLPKAKSGYSVQAEDVFWVRQGILRSTDLRDSLDEQIIADIMACIVSDQLIERSKDALDNIYDQANQESRKINAYLAAYGSDRLLEEIKYCIDMVNRIVRADQKDTTLRSLIFETKTTNPFPITFSTILLVLHELSFRDGLILADEGRKALYYVYARMNTRRDALAPEERRNNINLVKGLVRDCFVTGDVSKVAFGRRRDLDIENTLRRSQIETPSFEIKQGILRLDGDRGVDSNVFAKVLQSVCAIANIGREAPGMIFVGVADKEETRPGLHGWTVSCHWRLAIDGSWG